MYGFYEVRFLACQTLRDVVNSPKLNRDDVSPPHQGRTRLLAGIRQGRFQGPGWGFRRGNGAVSQGINANVGDGGFRDSARAVTGSFRHRVRGRFPFIKHVMSGSFTKAYMYAGRYHYS